MKKFEEFFRGISERLFHERGFASEQDAKEKDTPNFETVEGVTPQQIEAQEFLKQFTNIFNNGNTLYIGKPVFISPLNKNGEVAESAEERRVFPVMFTHVDNDAYCGKFDDKYYRFFGSDGSLQIYYFGKDEENNLQTTSISVNQDGNCIESCCTGEGNHLVERYQDMAHFVDTQLKFSDQSSEFCDSFEQ